MSIIKISLDCKDLWWQHCLIFHKQKLLLLRRGLLACQCAFTKCLEEEKISLTVSKSPMRTNTDFGNKRRKKVQILQKLSQLTGISWNMGRALRNQKDMLALVLFIFRKNYISQENGTACVRKEKNQTKSNQWFGLLEKKVNVFLLTPVSVFQQLGISALVTLSVTFKKLVWRIGRQLLSHLSVATED